MEDIKCKNCSSSVAQPDRLLGEVYCGPSCLNSLVDSLLFSKAVTEVQMLTYKPAAQALSSPSDVDQLIANHPGLAVLQCLLLAEDHFIEDEDDQQETGGDSSKANSKTGKITLDGDEKKFCRAVFVILLTAFKRPQPSKTTQLLLEGVAGLLGFAAKLGINVKASHLNLVQAFFKLKSKIMGPAEHQPLEMDTQKDELQSNHSPEEAALEESVYYCKPTYALKELFTVAVEELLARVKVHQLASVSGRGSLRVNVVNRQLSSTLKSQVRLADKNRKLLDPHACLRESDFTAFTSKDLVAIPVIGSALSSNVAKLVVLTFTRFHEKLLIPIDYGGGGYTSHLQSSTVLLRPSFAVDINDYFDVALTQLQAYLEKTFTYYPVFTSLVFSKDRKKKIRDLIKQHDPFMKSSTYSMEAIGNVFIYTQQTGNLKYYLDRQKLGQLTEADELAIINQNSPGPLYVTGFKATTEHLAYLSCSWTDVILSKATTNSELLCNLIPAKPPQTIVVDLSQRKSLEMPGPLLTSVPDVWRLDSREGYRLTAIVTQECGYCDVLFNSENFRCLDADKACSMTPLGRQAICVKAKDLQGTVMALVYKLVSTSVDD